MFGLYMRRKRIDRETSGAQIARAVFVSRQAVSLWESGKTRPTKQNLDLWCRALNFSDGESSAALELWRDK